MTVVCSVMVYLMGSMAALCAGRHTASNKNGPVAAQSLHLHQSTHISFVTLPLRRDFSLSLTLSLALALALALALSLRRDSIVLSPSVSLHTLASS